MVIVLAESNLGGGIMSAFVFAIAHLTVTLLLWDLYTSVIYVIYFPLQVYCGRINWQEAAGLC